MKFFFCYKFKSEEEIFSSKLLFFIKKQPSVEFFYWNESGEAGVFKEQLKKEIDDCDFFIFFWGTELGLIQFEELTRANNLNKVIIPIKLPNYKQSIPLSPSNEQKDLFKKLEDLTAIVVNENFMKHIEGEALRCAKELMRILKLGWTSEDGLPIGYPFDYEKDIIKEFIRGNGTLSIERVKQGCPIEWPIIDRVEGNTINPVSEDKIGAYRDVDSATDKPKDPRVVPAALSEYHPNDGSKCLTKLQLTFPEAGPRKFLHFPRPSRSLNVGIVVSGGIAPGINAVIAGIIKRHVLYDSTADNGGQPHYNLTIYGYLEGFKSLMRNFLGARRKVLYSTHVHGRDRNPNWLEKTIYTKIDEGGSIIPTSRADDLMNPLNRGSHLREVADRLRNDEINILYIIGGDGSMRAAHALSNFSRELAKERKELTAEGDEGIAIIGIPKTMDNDILWVWQSFGFLSAVEWATGAIRQIYTEVTSNPRICIIQLFGSDSGFVVTHAAIASGVCDLVLIPEHPFKTTKVVDYIIEKLEKRYSQGPEAKTPYGIVLLAETALPTDALETETIRTAKMNAEEIAEVQKFFENGCRVKGQTPDELRSAGIKIITNSLREALNNRGGYWKEFRVFKNEPRHLIRSIPPSSADIIFGERLGCLAVDGSMAGYRDFMISQWLTEYVMIPLELVVLGRKRIPKEGIFWKSVKSTTGQPSDLSEKLSQFPNAI
jgi:6-phosphofructokinase 1